MTEDLAIRPARRSDAADMALLVNIAGHGLPYYVWSQAEGADAVDSPFEIGRQRAMRDRGSFSWKNTLLADAGEEVAGMLVGYRQPDEMPAEDTGNIDPVFVPFAELEAAAPGTWYLNILAVFSHWRGRGVGGLLMARADELAEQTAAQGLSLIAADDNENALRFYRRHGFSVRAERPLVPFPGGPAGGKWLLMVKE
ncbi:MAG TPA: GNAT family N-acetyltransferase [Devosiaceae bacterium]|jgi:ribosomal protein S18 acetylase RimI-like enzyme|nr:GNAT family N-acetyltransferase [Devosiaceae bacterium]